MNIQTNISWGLTFRVWWHFLRCYIATLSSFIILPLFLLGFLAGIIIPIAGIDYKHIDLSSWMAPHFGHGVEIFFIALQIWVVRKILIKNNHISKYCLVLIEDMNIQTKISWFLALRVWWHFFWRYIASVFSFWFLLIVLSAIIIPMTGIDIKNLGPSPRGMLYFMSAFVIVSIALQIWVVRRILTKKNYISKYRLVLIEDQTAA